MMQALSLKPFFFFLFSLFATAAFLQAQEVISSEELLLPQDSYLLPRTVYVGDKARLVVQLGPAFNSAETSQPLQFAPDTASLEFSVFKDLVISGMELDKRNNSTRLLIDFVCYAPGIFSLPPLAISSGNETLLLGGLEINVASILAPGETAISLPALPLAFPGTGFMVYGTLGIILLVLVLGITGFIFAHKFMGPIRNRQRKRKLLASIEKIIVQLRADDVNNDAERELFSLLAGEFREFLTFVTGIDCCVLTPAEFYNLPLALASENFPAGNSPDYFCGLFRRWDRIRFNGEGMARNDVLELVDELGTVITNIVNMERT